MLLQAINTECSGLELRKRINIEKRQGGKMYRESKGLSTTRRQKYAQKLSTMGKGNATSCMFWNVYDSKQT